MKRLKTYTHYNESNKDILSIDDIKSDVKDIFMDLIDNGYEVMCFPGVGEKLIRPMPLITHISIMKCDSSDRFIGFDILEPKDEIIRVNDYFNIVGYYISDIRIQWASLKHDNYISLEDYSNMSDSGKCKKISLWFEKINKL